MKSISELKIAGIDAARMPQIRKEPYIDLVFKLSDRAPKDWCQDFNMLFTNAEYSVRVDMVDRMYIETWVRNMAEIPDHLEMLKEKVQQCNQNFHDREQARAQVALNGNSALLQEQGEQGLLNDIISKLNFD